MTHTTRHIEEPLPDVRLKEEEQPSDLEMLHMDAIRALERYREARRKQHEHR